MKDLIKFNKTVLYSKVFLAVYCLMPVKAFSEVPKWAKEKTQERIGHTYRVVCMGEGPSIDLARNEAISSCRFSALGQMNTESEIKTLSVETEKEVFLHQEVSQQIQYRGLDCIPQEEQIEDNESYFKVWVKCQFDLSKALISKPSQETTKNTADGSEDQLVLNKTELASLEARNTEMKVGKYTVGARKTISIASAPPCLELIIKGNISRVITCTQNPMLVVLSPEEFEITVRAKSSRPKTIILNKKSKESEMVQVLLEPY